VPWVEGTRRPCPGRVARAPGTRAVGNLSVPVLEREVFPETDTHPRAAGEV
jgi:hypothetical protein